MASAHAVSHPLPTPTLHTHSKLFPSLPTQPTAYTQPR